MGAAHLSEPRGEVLQERNTVGHLGGWRRARASTVARGLQPLSGAEGDTRMLTSPVGQRVHLPVVEQCHRPPLCQVHPDRAVALALPMGPSIDPDSPQRRNGRQGQAADQPHQRIPTDGHSHAMREAGAHLPAAGHADRLPRGDPPMGRAGVGGDELGQPLREAAAQAAWMPAHTVAPRELEADRARAPGHVHQAALITARDRA